MDITYSNSKGVIIDCNLEEMRHILAAMTIAKRRIENKLRYTEIQIARIDRELRAAKVQNALLLAGGGEGTGITADLRDVLYKLKCRSRAKREKLTTIDYVITNLSYVEIQYRNEDESN